MAGEYLLDTSVAIALLRNGAAVKARLEEAQGVCISATVLGELLFGALRSNNPEAARLHIAGLVAVCPIIPQDEHTSERYARVRAALAAKGKPIPENDIWVAAAALQYGLTLGNPRRAFRVH